MAKDTIIKKGTCGGEGSGYFNRPSIPGGSEGLRVAGENELKKVLKNSLRGERK
jgi:hypothetical protein